ncbi:hypothetical protein BT69DRAFT_186479 [Atractiella rhizophila]|nr:hypothetical protein BT69DRAFT_186479 [Atractiella rhizophila]
MIRILVPLPSCNKIRNVLFRDALFAAIALPVSSVAGVRLLDTNQQVQLILIPWLQLCSFFFTMTTSRKTRASTSNIPYDPEDHTESFGEPHSLRSRRASTSKLVSYKEELAEEEPHASEDSDTSSSLKHRPTMPKRVTRIRVNSISRTPSKPGPKARRKKNSMLPLPKTLDLKEPSNVCAFCLGPVKVIYHDKKNRVTTYGDGAMGCPKCFTSAHVDCEGFMTEETYAETQKYEWVCQNCKTCEICNTNQGKKGEVRQWQG